MSARQPGHHRHVSVCHGLISRLTVWVLDSGHICILTCSIEDTAIMSHIPISHIFVQPIKPVLCKKRYRDKRSLLDDFVLTSRSKLAYTQQSLGEHLVVQRHSLDD